VPKWLQLALLEIARVISLLYAFTLAPQARSETNEAIVSAHVLPMGIAGLIAYLLLTSWISGRSPRYGLVSTAIQAAAIAFGVYTLLNYWSVLR
jgi:hypothetical protein